MAYIKSFAVLSLKIANLIVTGALLLAYTASHISPYHTVLPSFLGLTYPYLLMLNLLFAGMWVLRRRWFAMVSLAAVLLGANHLKRFVALGWGRQDMPARSLKVMTYNVHLFNYYNWDKRGNMRDTIFHLIKRESPDVVCFQEFFISRPRSHSYKDFLRVQQNAVFHHIGRIKKNYSDHLALATLSSLPVARRGRIAFDDTNNGCIYTDLVWKDDTVRVYNAHLQSIYLGPDDLRYLNEFYQDGVNRIRIRGIYNKLRKAFHKRALQIDKLVGHAVASPYPVVICGDFNDTPFSYTYRQLSNHFEDAYVHAGRGLGITLPRPFFPLRIDYVFYSDDFEATHSEVLQNKFSDHRPLQTRLAME